MKRIPYGKHHIAEEDIEAVNKVLQSDFLTQGPVVTEFEKAFAEYVDTRHAVAVNNGTSALDLCVKALGLKPGEKVITTPITFVASANCVRFSDGEVRFCDIDRSSYLMDLNKLEDMLKENPGGTFKGIIPVDFAGYPLNMEELRWIADKHDLWIIEDACHAPGGFFTDSKKDKQYCGNGSYADLSIFSFHPVKHIATGEGGMVTTRRADLEKKLQLLRNHGNTKDPELLQENHGGWYYEMQELSQNYRLTDFQAALGLSQLKRAEEGLRRRHQLAARYDEKFKDVPEIKTPEISSNVYHAYHLYVIEVPDRKEFYDYLREKGIFAQVHYIPVHLMPYYRQFGWKKGDFPKAEDYYAHCISLPLYPSLSDKDQEYVIDTVSAYYL